MKFDTINPNFEEARIVAYVPRGEGVSDSVFSEENLIPITEGMRSRVEQENLPVQYVSEGITLPSIPVANMQDQTYTPPHDGPPILMSALNEVGNGAYDEFGQPRYDGPNAAWCATFVSNMFTRGTNQDVPWSNPAAVYTVVDYGRQNDLITPVSEVLNGDAPPPNLGDIAKFDRSHLGIVAGYEYNLDGSIAGFYLVEGNSYGVVNGERRYPSTTFDQGAVSLNYYPYGTSSIGTIDSFIDMSQYNNSFA